MGQEAKSMTRIVLLWFDCKRCKKPFLSYCEGKYLNCYHHEDALCFWDENLGEIHDNSYLNAIENIRECRKCRKGIDLMSFGLHT
jgi:hypothetical protein